MLLNYIPIMYFRVMVPKMAIFVKPPKRGAVSLKTPNANGSKILTRRMTRDVALKVKKRCSAAVSKLSVSIALNASANWMNAGVNKNLMNAGVKRNSNARWLSVGISKNSTAKLSLTVKKSSIVNKTVTPLINSCVTVLLKGWLPIGNAMPVSLPKKDG